MENRKDDGTSYTDDLWRLSEADGFPPGAVKATTFARPLDDIKSSKELKKEIVEPLLKLLS
jgi:hypothetical protein